MSRYQTPRSPEMAHAAEMLRTGQTRRQKNQALIDKALLVGASTAIGAVGHLAQGADSQQLQREQRNNAKNSAAMSGAIKSQTAQRDFNDRIGRESAQYAAEDRPVSADAMPAWLGEAGEGAIPHDLSMAADRAISGQKLNNSAAGTPVGGYDTPDGLDAQHEGAAMLGRDMTTGKGLMNMGGMMNSLPRVRR